MYRSIQITLFAAMVASVSLSKAEASDREVVDAFADVCLGSSGSIANGAKLAEARGFKSLSLGDIPELDRFLGAEEGEGNWIGQVSDDGAQVSDGTMATVLFLWVSGQIDGEPVTACRFIVWGVSEEEIVNDLSDRLSSTPQTIVNDGVPLQIWITYLNGKPTPVTATCLMSPSSRCDAVNLTVDVTEK